MGQRPHDQVDRVHELRRVQIQHHVSIVPADHGVQDGAQLGAVRTSTSPRTASRTCPPAKLTVTPNPPSGPRAVTANRYPGGGQPMRGPPCDPSFDDQGPAAGARILSDDCLRRAR